MINFVYLLLSIVVIFLLYIIIKKAIDKNQHKKEDIITEKVINRKDVGLGIETVEKEEEIPKQIMQTYKSLDKVPKFISENIKKDNPDWKYIFYSDKDVEEFLKKEYPPQVLEKFNSFSRGAHKADIFRLCWLYKNGGVYVDIDTHLLKPLDQIIDDKKLIIPLTLVEKNRTRLLNCFMVARKGDPLILECIHSIMKINDNDLKNDYCLILRVMQNTLEGKYKYEFFEKSTGLVKDTWHIYDKDNEKIADSRYENYDQIKGFT